MVWLDVTLDLNFKMWLLPVWPEGCSMTRQLVWPKVTWRNTHSWLFRRCYGSLPAPASQSCPFFPTSCGSPTCTAWGSGERRVARSELSGCAGSSPTGSADSGCWWRRMRICWKWKKKEQKVTNVSTNSWKWRSLREASEERPHLPPSVSVCDTSAQDCLSDSLCAWEDLKQRHN